MKVVKQDETIIAPFMNPQRCLEKSYRLPNRWDDTTNFKLRRCRPNVSIKKWLLFTCANDASAIKNEKFRKTEFQKKLLIDIK